MKYLLLIFVALTVSCINTEKDNSIDLLTAEELQLSELDLKGRHALSVRNSQRNDVE